MAAQSQDEPILSSGAVRKRAAWLGRKAEGRFGFSLTNWSSEVEVALLAVAAGSPCRGARLMDAGEPPQSRVSFSRDDRPDIDVLFRATAAVSVALSAPAGSVVIALDAGLCYTNPVSIMTPLEASLHHA